MDSINLANYIRSKSIQMCHKGNSSHIGSILSCADILAVLYSKVINKNPNNPTNDSRDRFIMSKGHAGAGLYSVLSKLGFIEESVLETHYQNGSYLSGHVCHKIFPGIEFSTGSLGHGLPFSVGKALALKLKKNKSRVFCLMSDGELDEGSNWEAFLSAAHHKLDNLIAIIDRNRLQSIEDTESTLALEPLLNKLKAFNWNVNEIDGHNHQEIEFSLTKKNIDRPLILIAKTTKGKGISFMENEVLWHYKSPSKDEVDKGLSELK